MHPHTILTRTTHTSVAEITKATHFISLTHTHATHTNHSRVRYKDTIGNTLHFTHPHMHTHQMHKPHTGTHAHITEITWATHFI